MCENKKLNYLFYIKCINGICGRGGYGLHGWIIVEANNLLVARDKIKMQIPVGWGYDFVKLTTESPAFDPNVIEDPKYFEGEPRIK